MPEKPFALSVKVVIRDENGRCLLLRRSAQCRNQVGKWDLPGGKIESGENFSDALLREVQEETGLEIELDQAAAVAQSESPSHRIIYLIMESRPIGGAARLSSEHDELVWATDVQAAAMDLCPQFGAFFQVRAGSKSH